MRVISVWTCTAIACTQPTYRANGGARLPYARQHDAGYIAGKNAVQTLAHKYGIVINSLKKYTHSFPDGREVQANLYPVKYLGDFHVLMAEEWMPTRAAIYFKGKDPVALLALDKMMM